MALEYRIDHRGVVQVQATRRRWDCWPVAAVAALLLILAAAWLFFSGYLTPVNSDSGQALSLRGKMDEQERLLSRQSEQIAQLESQTAAALRSREVQENANEALRRKLVLAESELSEARERLVLYEGILTPQDLAAGLHIRHFGIKRRVIDEYGQKLEHERAYHYHLVISNVGNSNAAVVGFYDVQISGKQAGKELTLKLSEVQSNTSRGTSTRQDRFSLKYYQSIEGNIELPSAFVPGRVTVALRPISGGSAGAVTKVYDWDMFNLSKKSTASKE